MSYSVGVQAKAEEAASALEQRFVENYPEAHEAVISQFNCAAGLVRDFVENSEDDGWFSVSVSGHAQQADPSSARDSLTVYISAISEPTT